MSEKLGRNIHDLIAENRVEFSDNEIVINVPISEITPNPSQPRKLFNNDALKGMADSILAHGIIQPIILKPGVKGYILVAGERRVRAAKLAGLDEIPAIVRDYNSIYLAELAILENLQREDLTPIEEALAYQNALANLKLTHAELGKKIGKSRSYITNIIGLLNLPASVIDLVNKGIISMGHARSLSKLKDQKFIASLASRIIKEKLTVRDIEKIIKSKHEDKNSKYYIINEKVKKEYSIKINQFFNNRFDIKMNKNVLKISFKNENELKDFLNYLNTKKGE
ncbi:MAG: ParB/RepB/Spo0J family partition protein [Candidatus Izemoplasma sp.]